MAAAVLAVGLLVFGPAVQTPWLWDDTTLIRDSPMLSRSDQLGPALRQDFWAIAANPRAQGMYRPVVTASYFADRALFGTSPLGPHLINLGLHLLACLLLGRLAWRLGNSASEALLAAALFGFHPAVVEAIANVSSRGDLLAATLLLGALLALRRTGPLSWILAGGLVTLAQLSKEAAFVALPLALILEWWAAGFRLERRRWVAVSLTLGTITVAVMALRAAVLGSAVRLETAGWVPVVSGASGALRYASRIVWPHPLVPYQPLTQPSGWAVAGLAGLLGIGLLSARRAPWVTLGLAWFLVATAPVAGWLPVTVRFSGLLLYLPLMGVALAAARGLGSVREPIRWSLPLAAAVMCWLLVQVWSSGRSLWQANVDAWPELIAPRLNLSNALSAEGDARAFESYGATITAAAETGDAKSLALAELGLGNLLLPNQPAEAEPHFRRALAASGGRLWQAALNLALALIRDARPDEAAAVLETQWQTSPERHIADAGRRLARDRQDVAAEARWEQRMNPPPR